MKIEYLPSVQEPVEHRARGRERNHECGHYFNRHGVCRLPRALSSSARSAGGGRSPAARPRSPSACPAPSPLRCARSPCPPDSPGSGEVFRAYFSRRPPPAPLWLAPAAPPPAPLLAPLNTPLNIALETPLVTPLVAPLVTRGVAHSPTTCEKEISTDRAECISCEAGVCDSELAGKLHSSRSTAFPADLYPPCNVAVQTQRNLKATANHERECPGLLLYDRSREWAGRLRDGHVRLALRALRQLRRAERLHRALTHPPHPLHPRDRTV